MSCKCGNKNKKCSCSDTGCHSSGSSCESFAGGFSGVNGCEVYYTGCPVEQLKIRKGMTFDEVVSILSNEMFRRDCEYAKLMSTYKSLIDDYEQLVKKFDSAISAIETINTEED